MKGTRFASGVVLLLAIGGGVVVAHDEPSRARQATRPPSPSAAGATAIVAREEIVRDCFKEGAPADGCLMRVALDAKLQPGARAEVVAPASAGAAPVVLGQVTLGPGMAASGTPAYSEGLEAYTAIALRLKRHTDLMAALEEYRRQRQGLATKERSTQRLEQEVREDLRILGKRLVAIPDRTAERAAEAGLCADAETLQNEIERLRTRAVTHLEQTRTALAAASGVACSTLADVRAMRVGWKAGNDLVAELRRILADAGDKTEQRRQILTRLNRDRIARDTAVNTPVDAVSDGLVWARKKWEDRKALASQAQEHYVSLLAMLSKLADAANRQSPNPQGPDWVFALFAGERAVRAPNEAFREAVTDELNNPPTKPRLSEDPAWMKAHEQLGRDIDALVEKVTEVRNGRKRACEAADTTTLDEVRRTVGNGDVEIEKYGGLLAKADACEAALAGRPLPTPPPAASPRPTRLWFDPDTSNVRVGSRVDPRVFAEFSDAPGRAIDVTNRVEWAGGERLPLTITERHAGLTLRATVGLESLSTTLTIQVADAGGAGGTPPPAATARLECDGSAGVPSNVLEIEAGQALRKTCRVIVTGWVSDTADRVFSEVQGLRPGPLDAFPPIDSAPGAQMFRAGVNDAWREYRFAHSFSAPAGTAPNRFPLVITVRQEDSRNGGNRWFVALPILVTVVPPGSSPGTSQAPPAEVRQGSGGKWGVWRYKLFGDPPPCFHFVVAVMGSYGPPGYEQVGANMTAGEADAEVGRLSRYFDNEYGCAAWPRNPTPPPTAAAALAAGRRLVGLWFRPPVMTARVGVALMPQVLAAFSDDPSMLIDVTGEVRWSGARNRVPIEAFPSEAGATLQLTATLGDQSAMAVITVIEETPAAPPRKLSRFGFAEHDLRVKVGSRVDPRVYVVYADDPDRPIDVTRDSRTKLSGDHVVPFTAQASDAGKTFQFTATFEWASDSARVTVEAVDPGGPAVGTGPAKGAWVLQPARFENGSEIRATDTSVSYSCNGSFGLKSNTVTWSALPQSLDDGQTFTFEMSVASFSEWKPTNYGNEAGQISARLKTSCFEVNATRVDSSKQETMRQAVQATFKPRSGDTCFVQVIAGADCSVGCAQYSSVVTFTYTPRGPGQ